MIYDSKCYDLAMHFLSGMPETVSGDKATLANDFAQHIQRSVENFLTDLDGGPPVEALPKPLRRTPWGGPRRHRSTFHTEETK